MGWFWRTLVEAWTNFDADDGWALASHVALSGLTALFPFLIFLGAVAGMIGQPGLADRASDLLFEAWPPEVAAPIAREVHNVLTEPRSGLAALGAVLGVYFAASAIQAMRIGLNRAYDAKESRPWVLLRLESVLFVFLGATTLLVFAFLVVLPPLVWSRIVALAPQLDHLSKLVTVARLLSIFVVLFLSLSVLHRYLAAGTRRMRHVVPGVALTCVSWIAFGEAYGLYLERFSANYISTYAGLASVMIAILFLYTLSVLFLMGGEFNAAIARAARAKKNPAPPEAPGSF